MMLWYYEGLFVLATLFAILFVLSTIWKLPKDISELARIYSEPRQSKFFWHEAGSILLCWFISIIIVAVFVINF